MALCLLALHLGCAKPADQPAETYRVGSHEFSFRGLGARAYRLRRAHSCQAYSGLRLLQAWIGQPVEGGYDLIVGETLLPKRFTQTDNEFLDVWQTGNTMFIAKGRGQDRVHQQFSIKSATVIESTGG